MCIFNIPKGTQITQRGAAQLDAILAAAERNKIGVVVSAHEDPYWIWDVPREQYSGNTPYTNYWKRNYRYRIARWGYSTSVLAWERWNEHGHISMGTAMANWYLDFHNWVRQTDPFKHLVTTSQGSQAYSPAFYSSAAADYTSYHDYLMSSRYQANLEGDTTNFIYRAAQCIRTPRQSGCFFGDGSSWTGAQKPIFFGEFDSGTANWNEPNPHPLVQHNGMWAGLFSEAGSGPIDWYFDKQNYLAQKYADAKVASIFFADIDYAGANFSYHSTADVSVTSSVISATQDKIRVLAMRAANPNHAYAWVQHKDHRWKGTANPTPVSGTFTLTGMTNGTYTLEYWNTTTGAKTTASATASGGNLSIPVNNLSADVAIKIRHSSYTGSGQTTPIPTATATQNSCPTDINQDNITDISDYAVLVSYFLQENPAVPRADINKDGIVDISDYSLLVAAFLQECP